VCQCALMDSGFGGDAVEGESGGVAPGCSGHRFVGHLADDATSGHAPGGQVGHDGGAVDAVLGGQGVDHGTLCVEVDQAVDLGGGEASKDRV
jgi:hypothetical protein